MTLPKSRFRVPDFVITNNHHISPFLGVNTKSQSAMSDLITNVCIALFPSQFPYNDDNKMGLQPTLAVLFAKIISRKTTIHVRMYKYVRIYYTIYHRVPTTYLQAIGRKAFPCLPYLPQPSLVHIWRMYKGRYFYQLKYLTLNKFLATYVTYRYRFWLARKSFLIYVLLSSDSLRNFCNNKKVKTNKILITPAMQVIHKRNNT